MTARALFLYRSGGHVLIVTDPELAAYAAASDCAALEQFITDAAPLVERDPGMLRRADGTLSGAVVLPVTAAEWLATIPQGQPLGRADLATARAPYVEHGGPAGAPFVEVTP